MRGRKPSPTTLKILDALRASDPAARAPEPIPGFPAVPAYLEGQGREEFQRIAGLLDEMRVLMLTDGPVIGFYAVYHAALCGALKEIQENGLFTTGASGQKVVSPAWHVASRAMHAMTGILMECGLTPASRHRIQAKPGPPQDDLETFLKNA
jgi:P27 family predicted phage terminase small subunit